MINIITGRINSSKTTKIIELFERSKQGDGFVSVKNMMNDVVFSYEALQLSNNDKQLLAIRDVYKEENFKSCCQIGPYVFNETVVKHIEKTIRNLIANNVSPIYLDEIGILEMQGKCFSNLLTDIVSSGLDAYVTIRESLVSDVIAKFNIRNYNIIKV